MRRNSQYRWWNLLLAMCLCAGALAASSVVRADDSGGGDDYLRNPDPPSPIGAGDPDIPQTGKASRTKPPVYAGRGAGVYRTSGPATAAAGHEVWMMRFHAAARVWMAYYLRH